MKATNTPPNTSNQFYTIVIPTLNEEKYLPLLLQDLASQTNQDFEVIVVDAHSEDKTVEEAEKFKNKIDLKIMSTEQRNVSVQRNLGGNAARFPWIIFMDADNRLPDYFLDGIRYQLARKKETDLFTTLVKTEGKEPVDIATQHILNVVLEVHSSTKRPQGFGAMIGCRKSLFNEHSFDTKTKYSEDSLFIQTCVAHKHTYTIFHQPRYVVSLRRLKKEGTLKTIRQMALIQLAFLQGKKHFDDDRYPMNGGGYYEKDNKSILEQVQSFNGYLKKASKKQIQQVRKLLRLVTFDSD